MAERVPPSPPRRYRLSLPRGRELELVAGRPLLLGVVNITPDSFSDGGRYLPPEAAVAHGLRLLAEGADALDLGAAEVDVGGLERGGRDRPHLEGQQVLVRPRRPGARRDQHLDHVSPERDCGLHTRAARPPYSPLSRRESASSQSLDPGARKVGAARGDAL